MEQKNWPVVRQQVGYLRYDTAEELEALAELYAHLRLYVNFFQPQQRLLEKTRQGATVRKRHDTARTPYQRVLHSKDVLPKAKAALTATYLGLNPVELKRHIGRCQDRLLNIARTKPERRKEVGYPPGHPFKRSYSWKEISRTSLVSQPEISSRTS